MIEVRDLVRNQPQRQANRSPLSERVDSKTRLALPVKGEIEITLFLKTGPAFGRDDFARHLFDLLRAKRLARDRLKRPILPHGRGRSRRQNEVGRRLLEQDLEVGVDDECVGVGVLAGRRD